MVAPSIRDYMHKNYRLIPEEVPRVIRRQSQSDQRRKVDIRNKGSAKTLLIVQVPFHPSAAHFLNRPYLLLPGVDYERGKKQMKLGQEKGVAQSLHCLD